MTLADILTAHGISQAQLAAGVLRPDGKPYSVAAINRIIRHGEYPKSADPAALRAQIETRLADLGITAAVAWPTTPKTWEYPDMQVLTQQARQLFRLPQSPFVDDVQTREQDAAAFEFGGEGFGDFSVAFAQFLRHAAPACRKVAACFAVLRNTRQSIGDDFAADNQDAFVAVDDFGDVALRHDGAGIKLHQGFEDAADVGVFFGQAEDAHAAHAVERFDDDVAVFRQKCADVRRAGGNEGRRG